MSERGREQYRDGCLQGCGQRHQLQDHPRARWPVQAQSLGRAEFGRERGQGRRRHRRTGTILRNFNSSFTLLLRDGQTAQVSSATDPISGEVLKVVVTLNVVK